MALTIDEPAHEQVPASKKLTPLSEVRKEVGKDKSLQVVGEDSGCEGMGVHIIGTIASLDLSIGRA